MRRQIRKQGVEAIFGVTILIEADAPATRVATEQRRGRIVMLKIDDHRLDLLPSGCCKELRKAVIDDLLRIDRRFQPVMCTKPNDLARHVWHRYPAVAIG